MPWRNCLPRGRRTGCRRYPTITSARPTPCMWCAKGKPGGGWWRCAARAETLAEKPAFRLACRKRRCLIVASGFYEWTKDEAGNRLPWYIRRADAAAIAFAGVWQGWGRETPQDTCAIVTTAANRTLSAGRGGQRGGAADATGRRGCAAISSGRSGGECQPRHRGRADRSTGRIIADFRPDTRRATGGYVATL